jgi:hypothetical protein
MKPLEVAARFAAFAWYTHQRPASNPAAREEAGRFARENWEVFLPVAQKGWGQLLLRVARRRPTSRPPAAAGGRPAQA